MANIPPLKTIDDLYIFTRGGTVIDVQKGVKINTTTTTSGGSGYVVGRRKVLLARHDFGTAQCLGVSLRFEAAAQNSQSAFPGVETSCRDPRQSRDCR